MLTKDKTTGQYFWDGRKLHDVDGKLMINEFTEEEPRYNTEVQILPSGDVLLYSHHYGGYLNYYLQVEVE